MLFGLKIIFVALVALLGCIAFILWPSGSVFEANFKASNDSENLASITINLGDDKVTLTDIAPNTTEIVRLYHDENVQMSFGVGVYRFPNTNEYTDEYFNQELYPKFLMSALE